MRASAMLKRRSILILASFLLLPLRAMAQNVPPPPGPVGDCFPGPWIVFFARNGSTLSREAKSILVGILDDGCGPFRLVLTGHAGGGERLGVGRRRAEAVRNFLRKGGTASRDLKIQDHGTSKPGVPIVPGVSDIQNRRVEMQVWVSQ